MIMLKCDKTLMLFLALICFLLSACSKENRPIYPLTIIDDAGIINKELHDTLLSIDPKIPNIPIVVRTVNSIPQSEFIIEPDKLKKNDSHLESLNEAASWYKRITRQSPSYSAIYLVMSKDEKYFTVRVGDNIKLAAYKSEIVAGDRYVDCQMKYLDSGNPAVLIEWINILQQSNFVEVKDHWLLWVKKSIPFLSGVDLFISRLSLPTEGSLLNVSYVVNMRILNSILQQVPDTGWKWLIFPLYGSIILTLYQVMLKFIFRLIRKKTTAVVTRWIEGILLIVGMIMIGSITLGSSIILGSGRLEDLLYLNRMGIIDIHIINNYTNIVNQYWPSWLLFFCVAITYILTRIQHFVWINRISTYSDQKLKLTLDYMAEHNPLQLYALYSYANEVEDNGLDQIEQGNYRLFIYTVLSGYLVDVFKQTIIRLIVVFFMPQVISGFILFMYLIEILKQVTAKLHSLCTK